MPNGWDGHEISYRAQTGAEKAFIDTDAEFLWRIDIHKITEIWDPMKVDLRNLPHLAYAMDVDIWEDDYWTEDKKRQWVSLSWQFKALRGTPAAARMALEHSGYQLAEYKTAPQGFFIAPDLTKEEYDAWIRQYPQLRIKLASLEGTSYPLEFFLVENEVDEAYGFVDETFIFENDGPFFYGRQAVIRYPDGSEVSLYKRRQEDLATLGYGTEVEQFVTPGLGPLAFFTDESYIGEPDDEELWPAAIGDFLDGVEIEPEYITIELPQSYLHERSNLFLDVVPTGLKPFSPRFERGSDVGQATIYDFFTDTSFVSTLDFDPISAPGAWGFGAFLTPDTAAELMADFVYLHSPVANVPLQNMGSFLDHDRLDIPPFYTEWLIELNQKSGPWPAFVDLWFLEHHFATDEDMSHAERAFRAIMAAKSMNDRALISFATKRPITGVDFINDLSTAETWVPAAL